MSEDMFSDVTALMDDSDMLYVTFHNNTQMSSVDPSKRITGMVHCLLKTVYDRIRHLYFYSYLLILLVIVDVANVD